jgi:hypothetical protein
MILTNYFKYALIGILTIAAMASVAGNQKVQLKWHDIVTEEIDGNTISTIGFDGAETHAEFGLLPVFIQKIKNPDNGIRHEFSLSEIVYASLASDNFEDVGLITEEVVYFSEVNTFRNSHYSVFRLLPLRKNPATGAIEKIVSFKLNSQIVPVASAKRQSHEDLFTDNSVLSSGNWFKIAVSEDGIYKVSYELLEELGVPVNNIQTANIRLFGNGFGMLPERNADYRPDDLMENAIMVFDGNDGTFDSGDYFIFFGQSPDKWVFDATKGIYEHITHRYTDHNYYFITISNEAGLRVQPYNQSPVQAEVVISNYNDFAIHERNEHNLIHSGAEWYGEVFSDVLEHTIVFNLPYRDVTKPVYINGDFAAKSTITSNFLVNVNGEDIFQRPITAVPSNSLTKYANAGSRTVWFDSGVVPDLTVTLSYDKPENNAKGWLNFIELNYMSHLRFDGNSFRFRNIESAGPGNISEFLIDNATESFTVWNIDQPHSPQSIELLLDNGMASFTVNTDSILEFIGFDPATYKTPEVVGAIENQNLHAITSADFLIVSHPDFLEQAQRLKALHEAIDGMEVVVADVNQVYNEFSSGAPDPAAVRDFARMIYLRSGDPPALKYLLLFGDGSYDPKNRIPNNKNFIQAYQSKQSLWPTATYVTDDFYGMMDPSEGVDANGNVDLGIGRLPANTPEEATLLVDKIESYMRMRPEIQGHWRNSLCFIADDEDYNLHFYQADTILNGVIERNNQNVNINKIYLDAYPQQTTASGQFYPEVNSAINDQVNEGALIVNYTGHGGEFGLAAEKIMLISDIVSWQNEHALPVFITATCEFSPFDNPVLTSAGELVLLNQRGGGVALFSTTRRAFASSNLLLNRRLYDTLFRAYPNAHPRLGDLMMFSKNPSNANIRNFVLLGNPAMKLALPYHTIVTDSINGQPAAQFSDTLNANSLVTISGHIEHFQNRGSVFEGFDGLIYPVLYDKPSTITTLGNDSKSFPVEFEIQNSILYKGVASVENGRFSFTFMLPKDISFNYGKGKLSYYAADSLSDASGYFTELIIGGSSNQNIDDNAGPAIDLYINDTTFVPFSEVNNNPVMYARLSDPSGINWTGSSIGRDITLTLTGEYNQSMILNNYFEPDVNKFQSGTIMLPLRHLQNGDYTLQLQAWDMLNNPSSQSIHFTVSDSIYLDVMQIFNYPNPFRDHTYFTFRHNQFDGEMEMKIEIFNFYGQKVQTIGPQKVMTNGYSIEPVFWDGTSKGARLDSGVYFYRVSIMSENGQVAERTQKMIITR